MNAGSKRIGLRWRWVAVGLLAVTLPFLMPARQASAETAVGQASTVIRFSGNSAVSEETIRRQLFSHPRFLKAARFSPAPEPLADVVKELVTLGYHRAGYMDAAVDCLRDDDPSAQGRWLCSIDEGPQRQCGKVTLEGCDFLSLEELEIELATGQPTKGTHPGFETLDGVTEMIWVDDKGKKSEGLKSPAWRAGQSVRGDDWDWLSKAVGEIFADHGYSQAEYQISVHPDEDPDQSTRMTLAVVVSDAGHPDKMERVDIRGLKQSTRTAFLNALDLRVGDLMNRTKLESIAESLYWSARFESVLMRYDQKSKILTFDLEETHGAPSIDQDLIESQMAFVKAGKQMMQTANGVQADLVFDGELGSATWKSCFGQSGIVLEGSIQRDDATDTFVLAIDPDGILFDASWMKDTLVVHPNSARTQIEIQIAFRGTTDSKRPLSTKIDGKISESGPPGSPAIDFQYHYRPSDWLAMATHPDNSVVRDGQHWVVKSPERDTRIDASTLQVIELSGKPIGEWLRAGEFDRRWLALSKRLADKPRRQVTGGFVSETAKYLLNDRTMSFGKRWLEELGQSNAPLSHPAVNSIKAWVDNGGLAVVDHAMQRFFDSAATTDSQFVIPLPWDRIAPSKRKAVAYVMGAASRLFESDRWPAELLRTVELICWEKNPKDVTVVLKAFQENPNHGPLAHWCLGECLRVLGHPAAKLAFAAARTDLSPDALMQDLDGLIATSWGDPLKESLDAFLSLSVDQRDPLFNLIPNANVRGALKAATKSNDRDQVYRSLQKLGLIVIAVRVKS